MKTLGFAQSQRPSVLFSLLKRVDLKACKNLKLHSLLLEEMIDEICKHIFFDEKVKRHRVTRWTSLTFTLFYRTSSSEGKSTPSCLKFVSEYQNDLPSHMLASKHLYTPLQSIFRSVSWFETLYQRSQAQ